MQSASTIALRNEVQRLMKNRGWSQRDLADKAGCSQAAVGYLLRYRDEHDRHPTLETLDGIARAFGMPGWKLLRGEGLPEAQPPLDTELLTAAIGAAVHAFRTHHRLPTDTQLAAATSFLYQRVRAGVTIRNAQLEVAQQLERFASGMNQGRPDGPITTGGKRSGATRKRTPGSSRA